MVCLVLVHGWSGDEAEAGVAGERLDGALTRILSEVYQRRGVDAPAADEQAAWAPRVIAHARDLAASDAGEPPRALQAEIASELLRGMGLDVESGDPEALFAAASDRLGAVAPFRELVRDTAAWLDSEVLRERMRAELGRRIEETGYDEVMIIGHGLGSLVVWDALARMSSPPYGGMATLGSPLGLEAVSRRLREEHGAFTYAPMYRWANLYSREDFACARPELGGIYSPEAPEAIDAIEVTEDFPALRDPRQAHGVDAYLASSAVRGAIAEVILATTGAPPMAAPPDEDREAAAPESLDHDHAERLLPLDGEQQAAGAGEQVALAHRVGHTHHTDDGGWYGISGDTTPPSGAMDAFTGDAPAPTRRVTRSIRFGQESTTSDGGGDAAAADGDAGDAADAAPEPADAAPPDDTPPASTRFLNSGLFPPSDTEPAQDAPRLATEESPAMDQGAYWFGVGIGRSFWSTGDALPFISNDALGEIFDEGGMAPLDVHVTSPHAEITPVTQTLELPRTGDSERVYFRIAFQRPGHHAIKADVLYRGNLLQSRELRVYVRARAVDVAPISAWPVQSGRIVFSRAGRIDADTVTSTLTSGVRRRLTVKVERDTDNTLRLDFLRATGAQPISFDTELTDTNLTNLLSEVRNALQQAMDAYIGQVGGDLAMLVEQLGPLAEAGDKLFRALLWPIDDITGEMMARLALRPGEIIQVAPLTSQAGVPWELLYERPIESWDPDTITLCPTFLDHGPETDACPHKDDSTVVCPWGFWGYRYIVEQMPYTVDEEDETPLDELPPLEIANTVPVSVTAIVYSSFERVDSHLAALEDLHTPRPMTLARIESRSQVRQALAATDAPADILYFYTHGDIVAGSASLLIGADPGEKIEQGHLTRWRLDLRHHRPLVVLNACTTGAGAPTQYESLVPFLARRGASGIIGTQCYVEEPLAGEMALRFLRNFLSGETVGEALFDARRSLLLDRGEDDAPNPDPRGLAYSLFASADVQLRQAAIHRMEASTAAGGDGSDLERVP